MDSIKIVIPRNIAKRNKARLRAQPDLKNLFYGDWGKFPQRAKLYKSTLLANLDKVVKVVLASGILVMLEASFFICII
ncbi:hypothetical protein SAMN02910262_02425 [[Clostridium] aminophilum]|uniref:Uncharacterized protein n=1 Tax=[Clostridium] aminophilum TaxID=1526 RepID=A0A1I6KC95_9FIRM|nr:hypothetical protein SAMN02910262_02425 [[Clostridium] aminophilum]